MGEKKILNINPMLSDPLGCWVSAGNLLRCGCIRTIRVCLRPLAISLLSCD